MSIIPYKKRKDIFWLNPFSEIENIQKEMNKLFDFSLTRNPREDSEFLDSGWSPAVDVSESEDNVLVKADLPGMNKDDIDLSIQDNTLVIKGEKKYDEEIKKDGYYRSERMYGSFCRAIPLSSKVQEDKVEATYKDGVLSLKLPKKEESKTKKIDIDIK